MADEQLAWLFPGQGAQQAGMGLDLYEGSEAARKVYEAADDILGYAISNLCFQGPEETLQETRYAQPALFVTSYACLAAARASGGAGEPSLLAGHSLGEYTALAAAGAFSFEDGVRLVQERGRLMQEAAEQTKGAMAAIIGLDADAVRTICQEAGAEVCNYNGPGQTVIGGAEEAVESAMALSLERGARRGVRLKVNGAYHTSMMVEAGEGMRGPLEAAAVHAPKPPVIANTSVTALETAEAVREELVRQVAQPVRWQETVEELAKRGVTGVIEFGPGRVLTGLVRRIDRSIAVRNVSDLASASSQVSPSPTPP